MNIPDISEFQGNVDWNNLDADIAIVRLCYGDLAVDKHADVNIEGARKRCVARGWYCYLVAGRDPVSQANTFCRILQAHGGLKPNEFIVVDDEESNGANEAQRTNAFLDRCDASLGESAAQDWWYSGLNFSVAHNMQAARGHRWIAAYGPNEPTVAHDLWQFTSSATLRGVPTRVDMSVFHGTVNDFIRLIGGVSGVAETKLYGGAMGNNILLPDPDLDVAIWRVVLQEGTGHVFWGLDAGGEGAENNGIWINDISVINAPTSGPICIEPGTLGAILHRFQGQKRMTFSGRILGGTDHWQTTYKAQDNWGVIEPWHRVPMNIVIASGSKGEPGPVGPSYDDAELRNRLTAVENFENKLKAAIS